MWPVRRPSKPAPLPEATKSKEVDEIQKLAKKELSSNRRKKRTAAWAGGWTIASIIGGAVSSASAAVTDTAMSTLGYEPEFVPPPLSDEAQEYHDSRMKEGFQIINMFVTNESLIPDDLKCREVTDEDLETNIADINIYLRNVLLAANKIASDRELGLSEDARETLADKLKGVYGKIAMDPKVADDGIKEIKQVVVNFLNDQGLEVDGKEVKKETDLIRGDQIPKILVKEYEFGDHKVKEEARVLDTGIGSEYLAQVDLKDDAEHVALRTGIRVSESKGYPEVAGKTVNLWRQTAEIDGNEVASVLRSGVFSVHSFKSSSIKKMDEILTQIADMEEGPERDAALEQLKLPEGLTAEQALERRLHLGVSQALPKILASIQESVKDEQALSNALATGSFLHAEMSYLSDFDDERRMLHDMETVIAHLNDHLKIQFTDDETLDYGEHRLNVNEDKDITITLRLPTDAFEGQKFGVKTLMFSQGVNFKQALSAFVNVDEQSILNTKAIKELKEYAMAVYNSPLSSEEKEALKGPLKKFLVHFTQGTENMETVDLEGTDIIADLIQALKGQVGIVCKSGKDRTGMAVSRFMSNKIVQGHSDMGDKNALKPKLDKGLSYAITAYNSGGVKGYAIAGSGNTAVASMVDNFAPHLDLVNKNAKT